MRQEKEIRIDNRIITIREVTVKEIRAFWQDMESEKAPAAEGLFNVLTRFMPTCVVGVTVDELDGFAPSEIKQILDAFMEVNTVFFQAARTIEGENPIVIGLREVLTRAIYPALMLRFAGLLPQGMSEPGGTDTDSSSRPSESSKQIEAN